MGFNFPEFNWFGSYGTNALQSYMAGQNYDFSIHDQWGWDAWTIADTLQEPTVFYENSHGSPLEHATGEGAAANAVSFYGRIVDDPDSTPNQAGIHNYEWWRDAQNGSGLPPFNYSENPPVEFAQMDSCESGGHWADPPPGSDKFSSLLYPYYNMWWPGIVCPDQAVLTWKAFTEAGTTENGVYWMFNRLKLGQTALQARKWMVDHNGQFGYDYPVHISETGHVYTFSNLSDVSQAPLWGDPYTRVKSVYTGSNTLPKSKWFNPPLILGGGLPPSEAD